MPAELPIDLGDGLRLRRSTAADTDALAGFNARIHSDHEDGSPEEGLAIWTRDLMSGAHPTFRPDGFTIVEEAATGRIVSCQNLIPQTWSYRGLEFTVGRIELVGTAPEYRRRGLIAAQMEVMHGWAAQQGLAVQVITGIPHYYRRFGYEMAIQLAGGRAGSTARVPVLEKGAAEHYAVRAPVPGDAPFLVGCWAPARDRWLVTDAWDEATIGYLACGRTAGSMPRIDVGVVEDAAGDAAGFVAHWSHLDNGTVRVAGCEIGPGRHWPDLMPAVLRHLKAWGAARAAEDGTECAEIAFDLGDTHPAYDVAGKFFRRSWPPYGWYVRVPDLVGFLRHLAPALEWRLADSAYAGHTGDYRVHAGDRGVLIRLDAGLVAAVEEWAPGGFEVGDVMFPELTFLQLLFGFRDFSFLQDAHPDCVPYSDAGHGLTEALFPAAPSYVIGLE